MNELPVAVVKDCFSCHGEGYNPEPNDGVCEFCRGLGEVLILPEADIEALEAAGRLGEAVAGAEEAARPARDDELAEQRADAHTLWLQLNQAVEGARRAVDGLVTQRGTANETHGQCAGHRFDDHADTAGVERAGESEAVSA